MGIVPGYNSTTTDLGVNIAAQVGNEIFSIL